MNGWTEPKEATEARTKRSKEIAEYFRLLSDQGEKHRAFLDGVKKFHGQTYVQLDMLRDRFIASEIASAYVEGIIKNAPTLEKLHVKHFVCACDENIFCQKCFNEYQGSQKYDDLVSDMSDLRLSQAARVSF